MGWVLPWDKKAQGKGRCVGSPQGRAGRREELQAERKELGHSADFSMPSSGSVPALCLDCAGARASHLASDSCSSDGTMDNRSIQMSMEGRIKTPEAQPSPDLRTTTQETGTDPTISGVSQVGFPDAAEVGHGEQPSTNSGEPEMEAAHGDATEQRSPELRTQEQRSPEQTKKQSSWAPQKEPGEQQADQHQVEPASELRVLSPQVPAAYEGLQQQDSGETKDHQGRQQDREVVEGQAPKSCQDQECEPTPDHQATDEADILQPAEPCCTLDSCGQQLEDKPPKEVGTPHIRPQEALLAPQPGELENSFQEATPLTPKATLKEKTVNPLLPSIPGPKSPQERGTAVETQAAPGSVPPTGVRDIGERRDPDQAQKQPQKPALAAGAQNLGSHRQGFMKCLLAVEEEEATLRRAPKTRGLPNRKSPRSLTPVPSSAPGGSSAPSLPPALPQAPPSAPATAPSWIRPMTSGPAPVPVGASVPASMPVPGLPGPAPDLGWRRTELLHPACERTLSYSKTRPQPEERSLLQLFQNWENRTEEHLTLKQEEAFRSYFELFSGHGHVDAQSLEKILLLVGISLTRGQVEAALISADVDGDGRVTFKDFLAVMTDTKRFFCSVEQNALMDMAPSNPHTLLFEILSLLVEMLAFPEAALEEITNYYQKKLKEGTYKAREMEAAICQLRSRKKHPYTPQQADNFEVPERRVLRILSRLKQQNYAANLQSPYAQVPCIPLCPRLEKKTVRRKHGSHYVLDQFTPVCLEPDIRSFLFQSGSQGSREHSSDSRKWLSSVLARTH
ncbi:spermatogenesis-associated protein 21 isoform X2 [Talpa occidentalis]|uniref:spermatogenesis-associated protein 21 isoform X2 n=1 Tax=Talpa occidentalis TaxID=50954 RepID=UPI00188DF2EB|nr:spermatogenesis-associated protein 21 isoform X2 [Talpa occidentalis]